MWPGWSRKLKFLNLGDFWSCPKSLEIAQLTWKSKSAFWGLLLSQMGSNLTCLDLKGQSTSLRSVEVQKVGFVSKKWLWSQSLKFGLEQTWIESNELEMDWGWTWRVDLSFFEGPTYVWWTFDPNSELWRSKFDMEIDWKSQGRTKTGLFPDLLRPKNSPKSLQILSKSTKKPL